LKAKKEMNLIFPLTSDDVTLWLAVAAIVLLIASELIYSLPEYSMRIRIERSRLRIVAIGCGVAFLASVVVKLLFLPAA